MLGNLSYMEVIEMEKLAEEGNPVDSIYTIGYIDRFSGLLEMPLPRFMQSSDIPPHRIMFFKKTDGDQLVWDR
jgi:hypothetical protein